ncbi:hypothetical protein [Shewanella chilikensis]|uniref:Uncharacterized protein n=1 Tax=Shewanella chilikensis TaxID=558541 RepID=A0A6G7LV61_9GAMM|nr:hypothetical protein [Shewanella chilikensis]QIJ05641.1 hypothetical protein GII14_16820 [Shewanella chilikensis]
MAYIIAVIFSALAILVLSKIESVFWYAAVFVTTIIFGTFIFPEIDFFYQQVISSTDSFYFKIVSANIEPDWSSPEYWDYLIKNSSVAYWWAIWPLYFGVLLLLSRLAKRNGSA